MSIFGLLVSHLGLGIEILSRCGTSIFCTAIHEEQDQFQIQSSTLQ